MSYDPDEDATAVSVNATRLLSLRDISLTIPINYIPVVGVSLTPACFVDQEYEDNAASKCLSNLLASGFSRFDVDLYWDASRRLWSLCPVELGTRDEVPGVSTSVLTAEETPSAATSLEIDAIDADLTSVETNVPAPSDLQPVLRRQDDSGVGAASLDGESLAEPTEPATTALETSSSDSTSSTRTLVATSDGSTIATSTQTAISPLRTLVDVGPYACTTSINLDFLTSIFSDYINETNFNVNATLAYLIFNLHAAASASDPDAIADPPSEDESPSSGDSLSSMLTRSLSSYIYTPQELREQRADLNVSGSWYTTERAGEPAPGYITVNDDDGLRSTSNGWPSEGFVKFEKAKRLLAGIGTIDPQLQDYDLSPDDGSIFAPGNLVSATSSATNDFGPDIQCYYQDGVDTVAAANNSWAVFGDTSSSSSSQSNPNHTLTQNLTSCGISPILNSTLSSTTAATNPLAYQTYRQTLLWSWAPDEPRPNPNPENDSPTAHRCAVLSATTGHWQTEDCDRSHHTACRDPVRPYAWRISDSQSDYTQAHDACPDTRPFAAPRTALENTYLLRSWRAARLDRDRDIDNDDRLLWLDVNDLDAPGCWVLGQNSRCPYVPQDDGSRRVTVPVVAGVVVFVVALLTVCVKCAGNRQRAKSRRKRGNDGWDYEGVPS